MTILKEHVLNPRYIPHKTTSKYLGLLYQYIYINTIQQGNKIQIQSRHVHNVRHVSDDLSKTHNAPTDKPSVGTKSNGFFLAHCKQNTNKQESENNNKDGE